MIVASIRDVRGEDEGEVIKDMRTAREEAKGGDLQRVITVLPEVERAFPRSTNCMLICASLQPLKIMTKMNVFFYACDE